MYIVHKKSRSGIYASGAVSCFYILDAADRIPKLVEDPAVVLSRYEGPEKAHGLPGSLCVYIVCALCVSI